jgi:predicted dehydrogenase
MKQVLQDRSGATVVRDVPAPQCPAGSLLVRNRFSAISSGTEGARLTLSKKSLVEKARERPDLARQVIDRARSDGIRATQEVVRRKLRQAVAVGYSSAGEVLEVGQAVSGFDVGDAIACAGDTASHAEIVSVPTNLCAKVPDGVPLQTASLSAIASIALHAVRLAETRIGERVAVVGCGLVGHLAVRLLLAAGAEVIALDVDAARAEAACAAGAASGFVVDHDAVARVQEATGGQGVDAALVTAAARTNDPLLTAAEIARDRGAVVLVGDVPIELPRALMYEKELSFRVSRSYGPGRYDRAYEELGLDYPVGYVRWTEKRNMEAILELQHARRLDLSDLVDEIIPVDRAPAAYERLTGAAAERPMGALLLDYGTDSHPIRPEPTLLVAPAARRSGAEAVPVSAPVRVGLIGPGSFASRVVVPALVRAGATLEVVGGGAGPSAEAATREHGFTRTAPDVAAVIADEGVDAVVITTHHAAHADLVVQALDAGKHVFCEKPLVLTRDELDAVVAASGRAPGILAVGFNRRFSPLLREAREFLRPSTGRLAATYRVSAGRLDEGHWAQDLHRGGGRILGEVCHFVDCLRFLAGADVEIVHAVAYGDERAPLQARDNLAATLGFADGSVATILYVADGSSRVPKERLEAYAGDRTAVVDDYRRLELFGRGRARKSGSRRRDKGHEQEIAAFLDAVRRGAPPVPLREVANVSLATLALIESVRTGTAVRLAEST